MKIAGYLQASPVEEEHNAARRRCGGRLAPSLAREELCASLDARGIDTALMPV